LKRGACTVATAKDRERASIGRAWVSNDIATIIEVRWRPVTRFMRSSSIALTPMPRKTLSRQYSQYNLLTTLATPLIVVNRYKATGYCGLTNFMVLIYLYPEARPKLCLYTLDIASVIRAIIIVLYGVNGKLIQKKIWILRGAIERTI
jgi:hypothetical protein